MSAKVKKSTTTYGGDDDDRIAIRPSKRIKTDDDYDSNKNGHDESYDNNAIASANLKNLKSITAIIKFMDKIEPGKKYYERQQDSRGECSKIRGKLRKYAKKHENEKIGNVAVAHYAKNKWAPPSHQALAGLIDLLRDMIDESWPLEEDRIAIRPSKRIKTDDDYDSNKNGHDESYDNNAIASANLKNLKSITAIIKFMDKIELGKKYYERQQDSRGECSKIRGKLRKYAKKHENEKIGNVAVAHYAKNKWAPPSHQALAGLIDLLRDMIDESWPLEEE